MQCWDPVIDGVFADHFNGWYDTEELAVIAYYKNELDSCNRLIQKYRYDESVQLRRITDLNALWGHLKVKYPEEFI